MKSNAKKLISVFTSSVLVSAAVLSLGISAVADEIPVSVSVNGSLLDIEAQIVNDRTMIPLRAVSNALGCGVAWNGDDKGITIYRAADGQTVPNSIITCWIDRDHAFRMDGYALGESAVMDTAPMLINDRTYVPIRAIAELLGTEVSWNDDTRTAVITGTVTTGATDDFAQQLMDYERAILEKYTAYCDYADGHPRTEKAELTLKNGNKIELELYSDLAPKTVANFVKLAESGYYNGLIFHRVISGFMIQGGGYSADGKESETESIHGEFLSNGYFNVIPHDRGVISMARTSDKNSASGQFFIMHADYPYLNGDYAAFGKVTSGIENVDEIAAAQTDENDKPKTDWIIERIEIIK